MGERQEQVLFNRTVGPFRKKIEIRQYSVLMRTLAAFAPSIPRLAELPLLSPSLLAPLTLPLTSSTALYVFTWDRARRTRPGGKRTNSSRQVVYHF